MMTSAGFDAGLFGSVTSYLADEIGQVLSIFPTTKWQPCGPHFQCAGDGGAFGKPWNSVYRFDRATLIVSLGADFSIPRRQRASVRARLRGDTARERLEPLHRGAAPVRGREQSHITGGMAGHHFRMRNDQNESFNANWICRD